MKKIAAVLIFVIGAPFAHAAPDLIKMAAEEGNFTTDLLQALAPLEGLQIDEFRDADGRSVLHRLALRSHQARALAVLLAGADANARGHRGRTPLFDVIEARDPAFKGEADFMFLEMLALRGAEVNTPAADGSTPLALAVERNDYRKAEFLIWRGAAIKFGVAAKKEKPPETSRRD